MDNDAAKAKGAVFPSLHFEGLLIMACVLGIFGTSVWKQAYDVALIAGPMLFAVTNMVGKEWLWRLAVSDNCHQPDIDRDHGNQP